MGAEAVSEALTFSRSLYEPDAVRAAVDAFAELARFEVDEQANEVFVRISEPDMEVAHCLADELANYALVETVVRRAKAAEAPR
jgi:hypothetical protein